MTRCCSWCVWPVFQKQKKKSFPEVNADIDTFKLQSLFFLHNICIIRMILWWYFSSVWNFCSRPTDAIRQENQCFFYLVVLVWTMALLAVKTLNMRRICFDPWLLTKITDRKGIILNKNQLQYLNEFIKPNLWNYQLFAWNTWETTCHKRIKTEILVVVCGRKAHTFLLKLQILTP